MSDTATVITILGLIIASVLGCEIRPACEEFICTTTVSNKTHPTPGDTPVGQQIWVGTSDERIEVKSYNALPAFGLTDLTDLITVEEENGSVTIRAGVRLSEFYDSHGNQAIGAISIFCPLSGNTITQLINFYVYPKLFRLAFSLSRLSLQVSRNHNNPLPLNVNDTVSLTEENGSVETDIIFTVNDKYKNGFTVLYDKNTKKIYLFCVVTPIGFSHISDLIIIASNGINQASLPVTINVV